MTREQRHRKIDWEFHQKKQRYQMQISTIQITRNTMNPTWNMMMSTKTHILITIDPDESNLEDKYKEESNNEERIPETNVAHTTYRIQVT